MALFIYFCSTNIFEILEGKNNKNVQNKKIGVRTITIIKKRQKERQGRRKQ
jgi:hypothetical protein